MKLALRALRGSLGQVSSHVLMSILANIAGIVASLPLFVLVALAASATHSFAVVPFGIALTFGVLPNPFAAGVQIVGSELVKGEETFLGEQFQAFRTYGLLAFKAWLISLAVSLLLIGNLVFYASRGSLVATVVAGVWLLLLIVWVAMHLYLYPLIMAQQVKRLLLIYRNALLITVSRPLATLLIVPVWIVILLVTSATGLISVAGLVVAAVIQQNAAAAVLPTFDRQPSDARGFHNT